MLQSFQELRARPWDQNPNDPHKTTALIRLVRPTIMVTTTQKNEGVRGHAQQRRPGLRGRPPAPADQPHQGRPFHRNDPVDAPPVVFVPLRSPTSPATAQASPSGLAATASPLSPARAVASHAVDDAWSYGGALAMSPLRPSVMELRPLISERDAERLRSQVGRTHHSGEGVGGLDRDRSGDSVRLKFPRSASVVSAGSSTGGLLTDEDDLDTTGSSYSNSGGGGSSSSRGTPSSESMSGGPRISTSQSLSGLGGLLSDSRGSGTGNNSPAGTSTTAARQLAYGARRSQSRLSAGRTPSPAGKQEPVATPVTLASDSAGTVLRPMARRILSDGGARGTVTVPMPAAQADYSSVEAHAAETLPASLQDVLAVSVHTSSPRDAVTLALACARPPPPPPPETSTPLPSHLDGGPTNASF
jgi:hypothetical protein